MHSITLDLKGLNHCLSLGLIMKLMLLDGLVGKLNTDEEKTDYRFLMRC